MVARRTVGTIGTDRSGRPKPMRFPNSGLGVGVHEYCTYLSESESETAFFFLGGAAGFFLGFGASSSESEFGCNKIITLISATKDASNTGTRGKTFSTYHREDLTHRYSVKEFSTDTQYTLCRYYYYVIKHTGTGTYVGTKSSLKG